MKCDELNAYKGDVTIPVYGTIADAEVYLKKEADEAIAELKQTIDKLVGVKKSAEQILQNLLDCGLIKEWYFNGKFNVVIKADDPHLQIAELKEKLMPCLNGDCILTCEVVEKYGKENAELKKKLEDVNELVKESKELLKESQKMHQRCADGAIKKIRHNKYKRCLAMAKWCSAELGMLVSTWESKIKYYKRWYKRWMKLADKYKEEA